jgi:hypothetical protein
MSKIVIAGFKNEQAEFEFIRRVGDATVAALLYFSSLSEKPSPVPIVQVRKIANGNRRLYSQHNPYCALFYLNQTALEMCEEAGVALEIVAEVEEMTDEASYDLEAEYLPLSQRREQEPE